MLNLTPHAVVIRVGEAEVVLPPSGTVARVTTEEVVTGTVSINGVEVPVVTVKYGEPQGLPPEGVECIVSALVRGAVPGRKGVYSPDTGPTAVRDEAGRIVAVTRLIAA